ncbi:hypothetical protein IQ238_07980 [Pleurocapsales cyanobacterium LEGE 06147]|nr:hypothetical protein [Pleurocapsales cyanobacterium LEGE 06147]
MNIFVLNTGRCGSTTFIKACQHITNFTSAHESRTMLLGDARFQYPEDHIEADNRLSWLLGRLERYYGKEAIYVHLKRNDRDVAKSLVKRAGGIFAVYKNDILLGLPKDSNPMDVSLDYCDTVNSNIDLFLKDKPNWMSFALENAKEDFQKFWNFIGAEGDIEAALSEFDITYNASPQPEVKKQKTFLTKATQKLTRVVTKLPDFIKNA